MKGNGKMDEKMEEEIFIGVLGKDLKESGKMIQSMVKVNKYRKMVIYSMDNLKIT